MLLSVACPACGVDMSMPSTVADTQTALSYEDCLRRCDACGIAASNGERFTYIYRDPLNSVPSEIRDGATDALANALNVQNRRTKRQRFGFSTSEDAITWVVFTYLVRSKKLLSALHHVGVRTPDKAVVDPALLLWGCPVDDGVDARGAQVRERLVAACRGLGEDPQSLSEPDVIMDLGPHGVVFVEVKHRSGNDMKAADYAGWTRYFSARELSWREADVRASGCYELARNWRLLNILAADRPAVLINLGPARLFAGPEGRRLDSFVASLGGNAGLHHFAKVTWPDFLDGIADAPEWFTKWCRSRALLR
jgi:hypothetical protein